MKQDALISWLEETTLFGKINTKNILFVAMGAFQGVGIHDSLEAIIRKRIKASMRPLGFVKRGDMRMVSYSKANVDYILNHVAPKDLMDYGLKPELVGRFASIGVLHPLTTDDKIRILYESEASILKRHKARLEQRGYTLNIDGSVLAFIVEQCPPETGARALDAICSQLFTQILYEPTKYAVGTEIHLTEELARELIRK